MSPRCPVELLKDTELYQLLLGLPPPWTVDRVEVHLKGGRVDVFASHPKGTEWTCPKCGRLLTTFDHTEERVWRHLDSLQFKTYLHARPPRVDCPADGRVQVAIPWAETYSRFAAQFETKAIDTLLETPVEGATKILDMSWDEAWNIKERAVERGLEAKARNPPSIHLIGVDEKAIGYGQTYATLVYDLERSTVEYVGEDRKQESLDAYFQSLTLEQRAGIEGVALDMWDPFISSIQRYVPRATEKMVFDPFHIVKHMNEAVNDVRKSEHRQLKVDGKSPLSGTRFWWLYGRENLPEKHREGFVALQEAHLKTGRAWSIKEALRDLWDQETLAAGRRYWKWWNFWATHSQLEPVRKVAKMVKAHLDGVLNFFRHRITNAVAEGLNSKVATIQKMAAGFRNKGHFRVAVLFKCGGLSLYPGTPRKAG